MRKIELSGISAECEEEIWVDTYLGLDFGGTKLLIGEIDRSGAVLQKKRYLTGCTGRDEAVDKIMDCLDDYMETRENTGNLKAAGLGIVGISDYQKGEWISMNHIVDNSPVPMARLLEEKLGVPSFIDNDVRSATTAELIYGQGKKSDNFIYLNVGTGLAAGFVCGGRIVRGANNNSGEIGHMVVDLQNELPCICGRFGCAENMLSGVGFTRQIGKLKRDDLRQKDGKADVMKIFRLADEKDKDCIEITEYAADTLAALIMNLVRTTDPDTVILGGGVVSSGWLLRKVQERLEPHTMRGVTGGVVLSALPLEDVGLIGAASLGVCRTERERRLK